MELLGRNIPNVPILGAVLKAIPIVPLDKAAKTIESRLRGRFSERVVTANLEAFKRGANEAKIGGAK
jgi:pyruvate ferredoxin oxidoreductase gamma subunit